jgi:hypothetical protein
LGCAVAVAGPATIAAARAHVAVQREHARAAPLVLVISVTSLAA